MKTIFSLILFFFFANSAFSQMEDGKYKFVNNEITLTFKISEGGWAITDINLTNNSTKKTSTGTGEIMKAGQMFWYQFQTKECEFEFDVPNNKLILSQTCENGKKSKKYQLVRKL